MFGNNIMPIKGKSGVSGPFLWDVIGLFSVDSSLQSRN